DAVRDGELKILLVFFRQGWHFHGNAGQVDAFVLAQQAAVDNAADGVGPLHALYAQLDQAVGEQNARTGFEVFRKRGERRSDDLRRPLLHGRGDRELFAGDQLHGLVVLQLAGTDLWPLQVGEDADGLAFRARNLADHLDQFELLRMAAV